MARKNCFWASDARNDNGRNLISNSNDAQYDYANLNNEDARRRKGFDEQNMPDVGSSFLIFNTSGERKNPASTNSTMTSSNLSLHIAYENLHDATNPEEKAEFINKWINGNDYYCLQPRKEAQDRYILPRQQEIEQIDKPEPMEFKESHRLLYPNHSIQSPREMEHQSDIEISFLRQIIKERSTYEDNEQITVDISLIKKVEELRKREKEVEQNVFNLQAACEDAQADALIVAREFQAAYQELAKFSKIKKKFKELKQHLEHLQAENKRLWGIVANLPISYPIKSFLPALKQKRIPSTNDCVASSLPRNQSIHGKLQTSVSTSTMTSSTSTMTSSTSTMTSSSMSFTPQNLKGNEKVISAASPVQQYSNSINGMPGSIPSQLLPSPPPPSAATSVLKKSVVAIASSHNVNIEAEESSGYGTYPSINVQHIPFGKPDETILGNSAIFFRSAASQDDDMNSDDFNSVDFRGEIDSKAFRSTPLETSPVKREEKEWAQSSYGSTIPTMPSHNNIEYTNEDEPAKISNDFQALKIVEEDKVVDMQPQPVAAIAAATAEDNDDDSASLDTCPSTYSIFIPRRR